MIGINKYYDLIEENASTRDLLWFLSKKATDTHLKNYFYQKAQTRERYVVDLKEQLAYPFNTGHFSSNFTKALFRKKYRKSYLSYFFRKSDTTLQNIYADICRRDLKKYRRLLKYTSSSSTLYKTLQAQYTSIETSLNQVDVYKLVDEAAAA